MSYNVTLLETGRGYLIELLKEKFKPSLLTY